MDSILFEQDFYERRVEICSFAFCINHNLVNDYLLIFVDKRIFCVVNLRNLIYISTN